MCTLYYIHISYTLHKEHISSLDLCLPLQIYCRFRLDRRRVEEAHMKFCVIDVYKRYTKHFATWTVETNMSAMLDKITPIYYDAVTGQYASS